MRTLVHLSDLHFGRIDESLIEPLATTVTELKPDVVVVSGDLTQRARSEQFKEAREFLDALPSPQIVVPGNHDVPLYNVVARFLQPLDKYRRYITEDLEPFYADEEIAVLGVNTARSLTIKDGRINETQVASIRERLCHLANDVTKIIVTHHPFDLPDGYDEDELLGRARMAMETLANCGADLLLAGHLHVSHTGHTAKRYQISGHSALVVQAGTATSTRGRGEANSFNVLRVKHPHISVERQAWQPEAARFAPATNETFRHTPDGWVRLPDEVAAGISFDERSDGLQSNNPLHVSPE
ncbi:MAG TPA: metallophosphoesterase family protein [Pyrinomonadaceae bacterium]|jgi:3',5'-cyclic AMP phosphodiesterase CpdA|nr:metallophosphoesterase family protein [Pyrinomonadaceae bacterium]